MRRTPLLWPSTTTPISEIDGIKNLYAHLSGLISSVDAWEAGLLLYQTAKQPPPTISRTIANRWKFIACNECVFELFHLRSRMAKIQSVQLRKCPSIRSWVDIDMLRSARKHLDEAFPYVEAFRHAIAHSGENESHPEVHAPSGVPALTGFREPDVFSKHYQGQLCRLEMTDSSLQKIIGFVDEYLAGFSNAFTELERQGHLD